MDGQDIVDKKLDEFLDTLEPAAKTWRKVEFRCMIQDILGNEVYKKHNTDTFGDRTIFYCISIPGENTWVRNCPQGSKNEFMTNIVTGSAQHHNQQPQSQSQTQVQTPPISTPTPTPNPTPIPTQQQPQQHQHYSEGSDRDKLSFSLVNGSYPIMSDGRNRSCLIKVYDIKLVDYLRVNDIVQISGLVEPNEFEDDSELLTNRSSPQANNNGGPQLNENEFEPACDFPHKLVPRVHVRTLKKLNHINPLLPDIITPDCFDVTSIKLAKSRLSTFLTQLLGGDSLAAEYIILSLISRTHRSRDVTIIGQLTVGLMGFKPGMKFLIDKLYEVISSITTHSHFMDLSIANLNNLRFTPKKDHANNKMIAGTLQLPDQLYLVLNETALSEGQLTQQGTANLNTLNHLIRWQKHNYDFKFHSVEIDTDLKVLVISENKSILNVPYAIRLAKNDPETIQSMRQACESVDDFLKEDLLNSFRYYITAVGEVPEYLICDEAQKCIQEDFIQWRQRDEASGKELFSADDLSSYMTIARYLTISSGQSVMTKDIWKETCELESARRKM